MVQNIWDVAKVVIRGKFIVILVFFKKQEKSQRRDLMPYLKELEKQGQAWPKVSRKT